MTTRALQAPDPPAPQAVQSNGSGAQQKLVDMLRRPGGAGSGRRVGETALSESEINALLTHHLVRPAWGRLTIVGIRLPGDGLAVVYGQVRVRDVAGSWLTSIAADYVPERWLDRPVWFRVFGPVRLETDASRSRSRALRLETEHVFVGRQRIPAAAAHWLIGARLVQGLRWPVPDTIDSITIDPGRVVIRTVS